MLAAQKVANVFQLNWPITKDFQAGIRHGRFARHQRLLQPGEFKNVFSKAKRAGDDCFLVLGLKNKLGVARLGLAVAKKHVKRAVGRNRIKRIIRESFRQHQENLASLDIVVLLRRDASSLENREIFIRLDKHWQALRKKCNES